MLKERKVWMWWYLSVISTLRRLRQGDYKLRPVWAIKRIRDKSELYGERPCLEETKPNQLSRNCRAAIPCLSSMQEVTGSIPGIANLKIKF